MRHAISTTRPSKRVACRWARKDSPVSSTSTAFHAADSAVVNAMMSTIASPHCNPHPASRAGCQKPTLPNRELAEGTRRSSLVPGCETRHCPAAAGAPVVHRLTRLLGRDRSVRRASVRMSRSATWSYADERTTCGSVIRLSSWWRGLTPGEVSCWEASRCDQPGLPWVACTTGLRRPTTSTPDNYQRRGRRSPRRTCPYEEWRGPYLSMASVGKCAMMVSSTRERCPRARAGPSPTRLWINQGNHLARSDLPGSFGAAVAPCRTTVDLSIPPDEWGVFLWPL